MYQLSLPLNQADYVRPKENFIDMLDTMMGIMGFGSLNSFVEEYAAVYRTGMDLIEETKRESRRLQIRKFNKRKAQRRAYCGRKRK